MSEVTLHVNGRDYRVRARDGEEEQLIRAGALVEERCHAARAAMGTLSDTSLYFYAALMLADDLAAGRAASAPTDEASAADAEALADRLEALAMRLEKVAQRA
ncbi:cell division protein ZapA [Sphingomicrobium astaxanthinifaciens]|uniref:cell division protein ZapA n=1 Tax=Sphingomicrobium astaxanthinifaciens TaxID=1227949 RepID=UPI001FCAAC9E|nr:cell division protein ZapA [Sphingomicrobium astaxanthinifaciens]MCJ7422133.1 cell division protein ZapA [Sphingomicrobium astaxanthinifaciens]